MTLAATTTFSAASFSHAAQGTVSKEANYHAIGASDVNAIINQAENLSLNGKHVEAAVIWKQLLASAEKLFSNGRHDEAAAIWEKLLASAKTLFGPSHPNVALVLNYLSVNLLQQGNYQAAESLARRSLAISEEALGVDHIGNMPSLKVLALSLVEQGKFSASESLYRRSITINKKGLGPEHLNVAADINSLASSLSAQGQYAAAESLYRQSLAIRIKALGPDHPDVASSLNNLALSVRDQGRYILATTLFRQSIAIDEKMLGTDHPAIAPALNNLALVLSDQGMYTAAEPLYRRSIAITEKALGTNHLDVVPALSNLALNLRAQGQFTAAEPLLRRSLAIHEKALGADHPYFATSLHNLASSLYTQKKYAAAEALYRRSLAVRMKALGSDHPDVANSLNSLATILDAQQKYSAAERLYNQSISIREKAFGPDHPVVASSLHNLASSLSDQESYADAEPLYRRSLAINEKAFGPDHPDVISSFANLAFSLIEQGKYAAAEPLFRRSLALQSNWLIRELPLLPDQVRSGQLLQLGSSWEIPFGLINQHPPLAEAALETRLNRQGLLPEIEQRQALLISAPSFERAKVEQLQFLTQQLASVSLPSDRRTAVREQRDELQSELYRKIPNLSIQLVNPAAVAKALPSDGALVEFQRFHPFNSRKSTGQRWQPPLYIALILKPDGSITPVPLGSAASIDATIHKGLISSAEGLVDAEAIWGQLSIQVFKPLLPHLKVSRQLFLSPDVELNRVPFAALPSPQERTTPLGQAVQLRLLSTGRELLRLNQPSASSSKNVVMANPSYDRLSAALTAPVDTSLNMGQRRSTEVSSKKWEPLSGSEREGLLVAQLLNSQLISGPAATTASLKRQQGPRVLHVATHGFFVAGQESPPNDPLRVLREENSQLQGLRQEDPQLRSGLVLAGANQPTMDPNDDGYLTASEAVTLNLKGTELVVLSACSTGQGEVRTGEGVYGLQRSLSVAGARSTLLSLWKVDDAATAAFMTRFYKRLKAGESRSDALASVQKEFREGPNPDWHHPYYWAAWQLVGDWRPIKGL